MVRIEGKRYETRATKVVIRIEMYDTITELDMAQEIMADIHRFIRGLSSARYDSQAKEWTVILEGEISGNALLKAMTLLPWIIDRHSTELDHETKPVLEIA